MCMFFPIVWRKVKFGVKGHYINTQNITHTRSVDIKITWLTQQICELPQVITGEQAEWDTMLIRFSVPKNEKII